MNDKKPIIRFCIQNPRNLSERSHLVNCGFINRDCLSNCSRCFETRFLEINDEFIEGESYEEILSDIEENPSSGDQ